MLDVRPFKGLRYNSTKVDSLADVITPPFDVISPVAQEGYYRKNPHNIIRIELGKEEDGDTPSNNKYSRASSYLGNWIETGILIPESEPTFYVYAQEFRYKGRQYRRTGLISAVRIEEWSTGSILPHEETLTKRKADRLDLMRACAANISPVFGLYDDSAGVVGESIRSATSRLPVIDFQGESGERHILWLLQETKTIDAIHNTFANTRILIADGHHRYETALNYRNERRALCPKCDTDEAFNFVMMVLVESRDPGLVVLPTHRMVKNLHEVDLDVLQRKLNKSFDIAVFPCDRSKVKETLDSLMRKMEEKFANSHTFGMFDPQKCEFWLLTFRPDVVRTSAEKRSRSEALLNLDVSILHDYILDAILGIDSQSLANESHLTYTSDEWEAVEEALKGNCQLVFFLNPTKVSEIQAIALAGERMPQKSTYFHPKLPTGLVINKLEGLVPVPTALPS